MITLARFDGLTAEDVERWDVEIYSLGTAEEVYECCDGASPFNDDGKRSVYYADDYNSVYVPLNQWYESCRPAIGDGIDCNELPAFTIARLTLVQVLDNPDKSHKLPIVMVCHVDSFFRL